MRMTRVEDFVQRGWEFLFEEKIFYVGAPDAATAAYSCSSTCDAQPTFLFERCRRRLFAISS